MRKFLILLFFITYGVANMALFSMHPEGEPEIPKDLTDEKAKHEWDQAKERQEELSKAKNEMQKQLDLPTTSETEKRQLRSQISEQQKLIDSQGRILEQLKKQYPDPINEHLDEQVASDYVPPADAESVKASRVELSVGQKLQKTVLSGIKNFLDIFDQQWNVVDKSLQRLESLETKGDFAKAAEEAKQKSEGQMQKPADKVKRLRESLEHYRQAIKEGQATKEKLQEEVTQLVKTLQKQARAVRNLDGPDARKSIQNIDEQLHATLHQMGFDYKTIETIMQG